MFLCLDLNVLGYHLSVTNITAIKEISNAAALLCTNSFVENSNEAEVNVAENVDVSNMDNNEATRCAIEGMAINFFKICVI